MEYIEMSVGERLGIPSLNNMTIYGLSEPTPFTPVRDETHVFREELARDIALFFMADDTAMKLTGWPGCGKTTEVEQFHAAFNLPLLTTVAHPRMEIADLIGHYIPSKEGGMVYHYCAVGHAARQGFSVLIDEYNVLDPGVAVGLNGIAQGGKVYIPETGEMVGGNPGFRLFAAGNPNDVGAGMMGRNTQDASNDDRFIELRVDYLTAKEEVPLVAGEFFANMGDPDQGIAMTYAENIVDVGNRVRNLYCGVNDSADAIDITFSTRALRRWAKYIALYSALGVDKPVKVALERVITNRAKPETANAILNTVETVFGTL